jgi:hypothetical protein
MLQKVQIEFKSPGNEVGAKMGIPSLRNNGKIAGLNIFIFL